MPGNTTGNIIQGTHIESRSGVIYIVENDKLILRKIHGQQRQKLHKFKYNWDKRTYTWFSNNCFIGNLRENSSRKNNDYRSHILVIGEWMKVEVEIMGIVY